MQNFLLPVKYILKRIFLGWKNGTFHLTTVKIRLFNISKLTSFFRRYISQNLLLAVKNSVNHYFLMAAKEAMFFFLKNALLGLINYFSVILVFVLSFDECCNGSIPKCIIRRCVTYVFFSFFKTGNGKIS